MSKILIIDDEEDNRLLLATLLEYAGHTVIEAAAGVPGVETAVRESPDVIVVDLWLPDIPGVELIRRLREDPQTANAAIALYTATAAAPALEELRASYGVQGVIPKPGDPQQILTAFKELVDGR